MRLIIISAVILLAAVSLPSTEINNGRLFLKIWLWEGNQIEVSSSGVFSITEESSPVSVSYSGSAKISITGAEPQLMWGIINRIESVNPDSQQVGEEVQLRQKFTWEKGKLMISREKVIYEDRYFPSKVLAERYADEAGYPYRQVQPIPVQNSMIRVTNSNNENHYYQLPVRISGIEPIRTDCTGYLYPGTFMIDAVEGKLQVSNIVDLESYIAGVVPNEIGDNAPEAALKAQAVASRTHAISLLLTNRHLNDGYDLCNGTHCQVYKGLFLRSEEVLKAVNETGGYIMLHNGIIADAVYHSSCGGKTESNQNIWKGKPIGFLQGVSCFQELDSIDLSIEQNVRKWIDTTIEDKSMSRWEKSSEQWERTISRETISKNCNVTNLRSMEVIQRGNSGRIIRLKLHGDTDVVIEGEWNIRKIFDNLPSSFFYIYNGVESEPKSYSLQRSVKVKGKGFGHGVGLCQVGALRKARQGWLWEDILSYYYPGIELNDKWMFGQSDVNDLMDRSSQ
jgi:SpoIID/LytB domain protein